MSEQKNTKPLVATVGLSWGVEDRCEAGEVYEGPEESRDWLLEHGYLLKQKKGAA